jgi:alpha-galactosidase
VAVAIFTVPQGILAAPLIMGNDLRKMSPGSVQILQNHLAVQINQDPIGKAGTRISEFDVQEVWSRDLASGMNGAARFAVALLNKGEKHEDITVDFKDISSLLRSARVLDVWSQSVVGTFNTQ